mmetsp:Transcript_9489/g.26616  ORF Transcript_9489/g.26616 Transcript_9489/m.26616 type:complete len:284 (+) Transcript_9489:592-1443(+)
MTSLTMRVSAIPECQIASTMPCCSLDSLVPCRTSHIPTTPFIGVRISWLIVASIDCFVFAMARASSRSLSRFEMMRLVSDISRASSRYENIDSSCPTGITRRSTSSTVPSLTVSGRPGSSCCVPFPPSRSSGTPGNSSCTAIPSSSSLGYSDRRTASEFTRRTRNSRSTRKIASGSRSAMSVMSDSAASVSRTRRSSSSVRCSTRFSRFCVSSSLTRATAICAEKKLNNSTTVSASSMGRLYSATMIPSLLFKSFMPIPTYPSTPISSSSASSGYEDATCCLT